MATVRIIAGVAPTWEQREPVPAKRDVVGWGGVAPLDPRTRVPWRSSTGMQTSKTARWLLPWLESGIIDISRGIPYGAYSVVMPVKFNQKMNPLAPTDPRTRSLWGKYTALNPSKISTYWGQVATADFRRVSPWGKYQPSPNVPLSMPWASPGTFDARNRIPWGPGTKPHRDPIDTNLPPPLPGDSLRIVSNLKVYYQMNIATVSRLPELTPLNFKSIRISVDVDSFGARWSGTLDAASYDLIRPVGSTRHEIEVTLNGHVWHLLVETPGKSLKFGQGDYQVTGRGLIGELAEPHAQTRGLVSTSDRQIHQLAEDELDDTGWSISWETEYWLIPAGAWSYEGLTPIQAVARLAEAAGAVVIPNESTRELTVKPRYPTSPWSWSGATPDWAIPMVAAYSLSSNWSEKPMYNAVVITGENQGVLCNVTRSGSAGDLSAPTIVDPLITHQDGGRERGRNEISDRGIQSVETLELQLRAAPDEPGLVKPLELVQYTAPSGSWRALVQATDVSCEWGRGGIKIKQIVKMERHLSD